ncbi:His Kinase A (phospho-acceptor) domain-containing protein [Chitinophaga terrae (ex Kim and Jung 2007)]|uniref:histidine kinase n=1 Tax=Chitinophaga terrae (ex Kim and Jung 2007) TaxID=408074 RepID=A0A1H3YAK0_9BACT|nr:response regulator [Chitinophaga terrae (ex Kim and Jung 2007)]GEP90877.1 hybrid sensor histidine kinase/response regulator [Chitinophaga terrae (ex Kim and Jung 2007)]SEA07984.1 His Kinase A (phospho-acceptor) domain-containing protein [Chitinophaga terrae (ex Kim and Jung 2007)]
MILIVDDKPENILSIRKTLELYNFEVDTALSGEEALKKILKHSYTVIILDVQMPSMDGFEVAEAISGYSKAKDIPIIFLSAVNKDKRFIVKGYDSGGIDYITKPVDPDILLMKVKTFSRLYQQSLELKQMHQSLKEETEVRKLAQEALIAHQQQVNEMLEQKVRERTEELRRINKSLEASNHDLQQFASVASHDLKEPLRKIQLFGAILKDRFLHEDPNAMSYMERIVGSSERMAKLINDLLNYSRLSVESIYEPTDFNVLINEILSDLELMISEKDARITVEKIPQIEAAAGQMRQVFQNIISNALKFSKPGVAPEIRIQAERVTDLNPDSATYENGRYCRIVISDNGIGFNEKYLSKIFTIFQRLHNADMYEGTGIGLAIAKKVIDKHGGIITAKSQEGVGTSFIIVLPIHRSHS